MGKLIPRLSIAIPTRNAGPAFDETLDAIARQQPGEPFETVVVDSGSNDGTVERCQSRGLRVVRIPPRRFQHGSTRNTAVSECRGEYVVLLVQDAIPANEHWLASLVSALDNDPLVAGAYSRHIPRRGASYLASQIAEYWYRRQSGPARQRIVNTFEFEALNTEQKQLRCTFNNVSSIIRRSVWENQPLRSVPYAEGSGLELRCDACRSHDRFRSRMYRTTLARTLPLVRVSSRIYREENRRRTF